MKQMMRCLVMVMVVLAVAGTAWSWDFADHVKMAPNGKGDVLIYPFYAALSGGWETKISVVNTATNRSVIARIGIYSARSSVEVLDFFLFLTPTDVWTGVIRVGDNNAVEIYSTDDSAMTATGVFASPTNPLKVPLGNPLAASCLASAEPYGNAIGYVTIVEAASTDNTVLSTAYIYPRGGVAQVNLNSPPVNKLALYEAYNDFLGIAPGVPANNPLIFSGLNVLSGYLEFRNSLTGQAASLQATTLRDFDNRLAMQYGNLFNLGGNAGAQQNTVGEIEAALSRDLLVMPYESKTATIHLLTFPTKQTIRNNVDCYYVASTSPFFNNAARVTQPAAPRPSVYSSVWETWGCFPYQSANYDLTEKSSVATSIFSPGPGAGRLCGEVNFLTGFAFDEGWALYNFTNGATLTSYNTLFDTQANINVGTSDDGNYTGAPVIGTVLHLGTEGITFLPASYTDGRVTYLGADATFASADDVQYYYYQYSDSANFGSGPVIAPFTGYDADDTGFFTGNRPGWNQRAINPLDAIAPIPDTPDGNRPAQVWP